MVTPTPAENHQLLTTLLCRWMVNLLIALVAGACIWAPGLLFGFFGDRAFLLGIVIGNQIGFLLVGLLSKRATSMPTMSLPRSILIGASVAIVSVVAGIAYDGVLRATFGADTPTMGPWGALRDMEPWAAKLVAAFGVLLGPVGDECFFRAGLFGRFASAGQPKSRVYSVGVLLSVLGFASSRLDLWNFPAYAILGGLLCWTYRRTGSLVGPIVAHGLLNAIMFLFLFSGYQ